MRIAAMHSMYRRRLLTNLLEMANSQKEFEDIKVVPPLDIIVCRDIMDSSWSSDRLLSWKPRFVPFKFYLIYLNEYFYRNIPADPNAFRANVAAAACLEMENKLSRAGVLTADVVQLSNRIKQQARYAIQFPTCSPVAAAGFMCIAEEAELMSELLECKTKNSVEEDVFITEVLDDDSFNYSNEVRKTVFDVLATYRGPCQDSVAAPLLGMKKEASLLRELLKLNEKNHTDRFTRLNICEYLRGRLLKFLMDINNCKFPEFMYRDDPDTTTS